MRRVELAIYHFDISNPPDKSGGFFFFKKNEIFLDF